MLLLFQCQHHVSDWSIVLTFAVHAFSKSGYVKIARKPILDNLTYYQILRMHNVEIEIHQTIRGKWYWQRTNSNMSGQQLIINITFICRNQSFHPRLLQEQLA